MYTPIFISNLVFVYLCLEASVSNCVFSPLMFPLLFWDRLSTSNLFHLRITFTNVSMWVTRWLKLFFLLEEESRDSLFLYVSTVSEGDSASPEEVPVFLETEDHTFQGLSA